MKKQTIITIFVMFALFAAIAVLAIIKGHNAKIPENSPETIGNTSGNLNNMGYFCEHGDRIYFANSYDNYNLYSLDPVTMNATLLMDVPVEYINAAGDYLYFYYNDTGSKKFMGVSGSRRGVYRYKINGKDALTCLDRTTSGIVALSGNNVYYQHYDNNEGMTLYSVGTNGKDKHQVINEIVNPSCIIDANIFYPDTGNMFYLNHLNIETASSELYIKERMYNPVSSNGYIYYINVDDNYCLYRYGLHDNSRQKITKERVDLFNVYGETVFYQTNSDSRPRLVRIQANGGAPEIIAQGNFTDINCTSSFTFFRAFDDEFTFYMVPTVYGTSFTVFNPVFD